MVIAMTQEELIKEIHQLPLDKRKVVLRAIERSVQDEQQSAGKPNQVQLSVDERLAVVHRLFGILKREGEAPTDEELKQEYANYLAEKYS